MSQAKKDPATARASVLNTQEIVERHLTHEEQELEPQLRPHLDSPGWKAVEKKLRAVSPRVAGSFFAWLTDGMSDPDRAYLPSTAPPPVVAVLSTVLGRSYTRQVAPIWRNGS